MTQSFREEMWKWIMKQGTNFFLLCVVGSFVAYYVVIPLAEDYRMFVRGVATASGENAKSSAKMAEIQSVQAETLRMVVVNTSSILDIAKEGGQSDRLILENQADLKVIIKKLDTLTDKTKKGEQL